eukprot:TRINITY_DN15811_c0_g1_i1.p1 TRINITY_DN15811_c0_g1~~TRINITY_DN15811_c0_g1_i1.p1  ORF type:complete len:425 (-),score=89.58 TRINITY_DN15811_c0_g1_i1:265-1539(-)
MRSRGIAALSATGKWIAKRMYSNNIQSPSINSAEATAIQMVDYVRQHSYPHSAKSHTEVMRVLEQGLAVFPGDSMSTANAAGRLLLAMATICADREELKAAEEKLEEISELAFTSLDVRVAALEALAGLQLRIFQDGKALDYADACLHLLENAPAQLKEENLFGMKIRAKAIKGLVELVHGNLNSAASYFSGWNLERIKGSDTGSGAATLAYAEFLHINGDLQLAKEMYKYSLEVSTHVNRQNNTFLAACAMIPEEVHLGATCGLGQLATHCGMFEEAEEHLTQLLRETEKRWGDHSCKVGIVLGCIADMFGHKGRAEGKSYFLVQEGLYRRALEILNAPHYAEKGIDLQDVIALIRGGYSHLLSQQQSRSKEADKMREWSASVWQNRRVSLETVLEKIDSVQSKGGGKQDATVVTDIRLGRVI